MNFPTIDEVRAFLATLHPDSSIQVFSLYHGLVAQTLQSQGLDKPIVDTDYWKADHRDSVTLAIPGWYRRYMALLDPPYNTRRKASYKPRELDAILLAVKGVMDCEFPNA